jgi:hypothetical protein
MLKKMLIPASCMMLLVAVIALVHAAETSAPVPAPIQSVMTPYLQVHDALAKDSMEGVSAAAVALGKAAKTDKTFPSELSKEAQALAQAKDLAAARDAFKPLSATLIKVLADNHVGSGAYVEAYCPMVNASWLQTGTTVSNPFGASMATCGSIVNGTAAPGKMSCHSGCSM